MTEEELERRRIAALERGRRWRERNRDRYLAAHAAAQRRYRAEGRIHDQEWRKAWRAAHPETVRTMNRKAGRKYAKANPEAERGRRERFRALNPDYWRERRDRGRVYEAAYRERHPGRRPWHTRKIAKAGVVLIVRVTADQCGVCFGPLLQSRRHPDPLATTVGHEPPLIVAARDGWTVVVERPEHLRCNLWKGERLDAELPVHAATSFAPSIHDTIAAAARAAAPDL